MLVDDFLEAHKTHIKVQMGGQSGVGGGVTKVGFGGRGQHFVWVSKSFEAPCRCVLESSRFIRFEP